MATTFGNDWGSKKVLKNNKIGFGPLGNWKRGAKFKIGAKLKGNIPKPLLRSGKIPGKFPGLGIFPNWKLSERAIPIPFQVVPNAFSYKCRFTSKKFEPKKFRLRPSFSFKETFLLFILCLQSNRLPLSMKTPIDKLLGTLTVVYSLKYVTILNDHRYGRKPPSANAASSLGPSIHCHLSNVIVIDYIRQSR